MSKRISRDEFVFLFIFSIWFFFNAINRTLWMNHFDMLTIIEYSHYMIYALVLYMLLSVRDRTALEYVVCIEFIALSYGLWKISGNHWVFLTGLLMVAAARVDYKKIFAVAIVVLIIAMIAAFWGILTGLLENKAWENGARIRYDLGYRYCTFSSYMVFFISMMYMTIREKLKLIECAVIVIVQAVFFAFTRTNTTLIVTVIIMATYVFFYSTKKEIPHAVGIAGCLTPFLFMVITYLVGALYNPKKELWVKANDMFSDRFRLQWNAIKEYQILPFGQDIDWAGWDAMAKHPEWGYEKYNNVDCFFLRYLLTYGIIYAMILVLVFAYVIYKSYKNNNLGLFCATIGMMMFGLVNTEVIDLRFHPFVLMVGYVISMERKTGGRLK